MLLTDLVHWLVEAISQSTPIAGGLILATLVHAMWQRGLLREVR